MFRVLLVLMFGPDTGPLLLLPPHPVFWIEWHGNRRGRGSRRRRLRSGLNAPCFIHSRAPWESSFAGGVLAGDWSSPNTRFSHALPPVIAEGGAIT